MPGRSLGVTEGEVRPVVLVIGQAGVGKSSLINAALRKNSASVGDLLDDGTKDAEPFFCEDGEPPVYLVDTPGLDNTWDDDRVTMEGILSSLESKLGDKMQNTKFRGILYLVEAGQRNLPMHNRLKQSPLLRDRLVVVGTKADAKLPIKWKTDVACEVSNLTECEAASWKAVEAELQKVTSASDIDLKKFVEDFRKELGPRRVEKKAAGHWHGMFSFLFKMF